jgi:diguanylate cyclase (GGDEF)-like protein
MNQLRDAGTLAYSRSTKGAHAQMWVDADDEHPFATLGLRRRLVPFVLTITIGAMIAATLDGRAFHPALLLAGAILGAVAMSAAFLLPWRKMPRRSTVVPPLMLIVAQILVRHGAEAPPPHFAPLVLVPLLWLTLYHDRVDLLAGYGVVAAMSLGARLLGHADPATSQFQLFGAGITLVTLLAVQDRVARERARVALLLALSHTDTLTSAANRRAWDERLTAELARARRDDKPCSVVVLDLDRFKDVNDSRGHAFGDRVLIEATRAWQQALRTSDLLARVGGEEFAALLPSCGAEHAGIVAERLRAATPMGMTVSCGVATWDGDEQPSALVARADAALYAAKAAGRDRVVAAAPTAPARPRIRSASSTRLAIATQAP